MPTVQWLIDSDTSTPTDLTQDEEHFHIANDLIGCEDDDHFICNYESKVEFIANDEFLENLHSSYGIKVSEHEEVQATFTLVSEVSQGIRNIERKEISVELTSTADHLTFQWIMILVTSSYLNMYS